MRRLFLFLALLPLAAPIAAEDPPEDRGREALRFAESLHQEGDHYRAITEYKRAAFLAPGTEVETKALLGIGLSYRDGRKWEQAIDAFRDLAEVRKGAPAGEKARFELAETFRQSGDDLAAWEAFRKFLEDFPGSADADLARLHLAACLARLGRFQSAIATLDQLPPESPLAPDAKKAREGLQAPPDLKPKSPGLAGTMSAVIPGMGQWYAGRPAGGAAYFLINAALIGGAVESFNTDRNVLGAVLATAAGVAYVSNIYGAVGDAHKANREVQDRYLEGIERSLRLREADLARIGPGGREASPGFAMVWTIRF